MVGAGSLVTRDVADFALVYGEPGPAARPRLPLRRDAAFRERIGRRGVRLRTALRARPGRGRGGGWRERGRGAGPVGSRSVPWRSTTGRSARPSTRRSRGSSQRGWFVLGEEVAAFEARLREVPRRLSRRRLRQRHRGDRPRPAGRSAPARRTKSFCPRTPAARRWPACGWPAPARVLADVDEDTLTLGAAEAEKVAHCPRRAFLLPVHLYGGLADLAGSRGARRRAEELALVEDCAQSHGALLEGRAAGSFGSAAAFSFYPSKNLGAYGDGGAVATNEPETAGRLRQLRQYGWSRRDFAESEGWNSRLDELQAAILAGEAAFARGENARRLQIANRYDAAFAGLPLAPASRTRSGSVPARHLYPVRTENAGGAPPRTCRSEASRPPSTIPSRCIFSPRTPFSAGRSGDFPVSEEACETSRPCRSTRRSRTRRSRPWWAA